MKMNLGLIFLTICAVWIVSELTLLIWFRARTDSQNRDQGSLKWLNIVIYTCVTLAVILGFLRIGAVNIPGPVIPWVGLTLIVLGLIIRWVAILTLRRFFTTNVAIQSGHRLIRTGLYRIIRHPSYTGSLVSFWGLGLAFSNWLSFIVLAVPITIVFLKRIGVEEQALLSAFGEEYVNYRQTSRALLPWIY